jgi:hypothetical protein
MEQKSDNSNNANSMVLATNGLRYVLPKPLSTTLVRTFKKQYSQRQSYSATDTIVFDLNITGQVDPEVSYLMLKLSSDADFEFAQNGVCSIIRDIRISSKNGVELDRIQSFNAWTHLYLSHMVDADKINKDGRLAGVNTGFTGATVNTFVIPLTWLSGLFRPHVKGQKVPSHMLSGARIEIQLETVGRALRSTDNPAPTLYTVETPTLVLMEHTLNDNTLKVLTEESANNGLEYVYDRVFTSIETSANAIVNIQVKKAVSQATAVITTVHDPAKQNAVAQFSFNSLDVSSGSVFLKYQYRLGSNYFPHQSVDSEEDAYRVTESTYDSTREKAVVSANSFIDYIQKYFAVGVPLKSEHSISSSGLAVNNSATIALEFEGNATNKIYYTFLVYTALARTFLNQTSCKI